VIDIRSLEIEILDSWGTNMKFDLLCVDLFQTLVDLDKRIPYIWQSILQDNYSEAFVSDCVESLRKHVYSGFHKSTSTNTEFLNLQTMFNPFFQVDFFIRGLFQLFPLN
jgi:hypothetical protein